MIHSVGDEPDLHELDYLFQGNGADYSALDLVVQFQFQGGMGLLALQARSTRSCG